MKNTSQLVKEMLELTRWDVALWMSVFGKIRLKRGEVTECEPNEYQRKLSEIIEYCHINKIPCRIIALKPRQKGSTTFSVCAAYRRLMAKIGRGLFAGGSHFQASNMWKIFETYVNHDAAERHRVKLKSTESIFDNGSTLERITLRNVQAGRSGTYQVLIITEVAYLSDEGVANADNVIAGLLKCVPDEPDTIIIEESTAHGATGYFHDKYKNRSVTFEEFKAGKPGTIRVFSPWFEFKDSRRDPAREQIASEEDLTKTERELAEEWDLDLHQVAWMRWAIREECNGDFEKFLEDYPFDDETAFLKSGRCKFSAVSLKRQQKLSEIANWRYGEFHKGESGQVGWIDLPYEQSMWSMREEPMEQRRYILACDPATGASNTSGADPDSHGVGIIRSGYMDMDGNWVEPCLVLRNTLHRDGDSMACRWDTDVLADQIMLASEYYGKCLIAPEMNRDNGLVEILKHRGANLYVRQEINRRTDEVTDYYGWRTDANNRGMIIDKFAAAIRDSGKGIEKKGISVACPWTIQEMRSFVINAAGRAEAASGKHDDQVMMLCIGYHLLELATPFFSAKRLPYVPPEIRSWQNGINNKNQRGEFSV